VKSLIAVLTLALAIITSAQESLTNDSVLKLVKSGLSEDLIVSLVQNQPGKYSLTPDDVVRLKETGVSEKILKAMADKNSSGSVKIELKTPVRLSVDETISSKSAKAGDTLKLVASEQVMINGHIVIAKGAPATGRIIAAEKRAFATNNGKLEVAVDSVRTVDGHNVAVDGHLSIGGGGAGAYRTGKEAQIEKGQIINAVVASETTVTIQATER
jgi:hypothetical protein